MTKHLFFTIKIKNKSGENPIFSQHRLAKTISIRITEEELEVSVLVYDIYIHTHMIICWRNQGKSILKTNLILIINLHVYKEK